MYFDDTYINERLFWRREMLWKKVIIYSIWFFLRIFMNSVNTRLKVHVHKL